MKILLLSGLFSIVLFLLSCDNSTDSGNDYILQRGFEPSDIIQILEKPGEFKITIPANALKGNIEFKVKKESTASDFNVSNFKLGKNIYKISLKGECEFLKPIVIELNYDPALVQSGKTPEESVKGFVKKWGINLWKSYENCSVSTQSKKIIFSFNDFYNVSTNKQKDELQEYFDEITLGDGYSMTDSGNEDELLNKMIYFWTTFAFQGIRDDDIVMDLSFDILNTSSDNFQKVMWNSNKFTIAKNDSTQYGYSKFTATGEIDKSNWTLKNCKLHYLIYDNYSSMSTHLEEYVVEFNDIKGIKNEYGSNPIWLTFAGVYNGSGSQSDFKNAVKDISYKITNYEMDGTTISNEHILKSVNWNNYTNQIHFNLYQVKQ